MAIAATDLEYRLSRGTKSDVSDALRDPDMEDAAVIDWTERSSGNILADGDMEASGVTEWTAGNSATLTKDVADSKEGSQNLRIAYNAVADPSADQTILESGIDYRFRGWAKGDATQVPRIDISVTGTIWTGLAAAEWQYFDVTATSGGTDVLFINTGSAGFVEFDGVTITKVNSDVTKSTMVPHVGTRSLRVESKNVIADSDMEAAGVTSWTAGNSATLSKETTTPHSGLQVLRVAYNAVNDPSADQVVLTSGKDYRVTGFARSDGTAIPKFEASSIFWTGTTSTSWQEFAVDFTADGTSAIFKSVISASGYTEWDDVNITEVYATSVDIDAQTAAAAEFTHIVGKAYTLSGYARSEGIMLPTVYDGTTQLWQGTASTAWQAFSVDYTATDETLRLSMDGIAGRSGWDSLELLQSTTVLPDESLGGVLAPTRITLATLNNLFDDVTTAEALAGSIEFRCLYVRNNHATDTLTSVKVWIDSETSGADSQLDIGLDPAGIGDGQSRGLATNITEELASAFEGILLEPAAENIFPYFADFQTGWVQVSSTVNTSSGVDAPDGSENAQGLIGDAGFGSHYFRVNITWTAADHAISIYAKKGALEWFKFRNSGNAEYCWFNVNTGVVGSSSAGSSGTILDMGNGWYRCTFLGPMPVGAASVYLWPAESDTGASLSSYTADGSTVDLYFWGAQAELGSAPSSPIFTSGSTETRPAESLIYDATDGNVDLDTGRYSVDFMTPHAAIPAAANTFASLNDGGSPSDELAFQIQPSTGYLTCVITHPSFSSTIASSVNVADGAAHNATVEYSIDSNYVRFYIDNVLIDTYTIPGTPVDWAFTQVEYTPSEAMWIRNDGIFSQYNTSIFDSIDGANGVARLSDAITINNQTVRPTFVYIGNTAKASTWSAKVGNDLILAGAGSEPSLNQPSFGNGPGDTSVVGNNGKYYTYAGGGSDLSTDDFVFEFLVDPKSIAISQVLSAQRNTVVGWDVRISSSVVSLFIKSSGDKFINSPTIIEGELLHVVIVGDRSGSAVVYTNGVAGTPFSMSSIGDLTNSEPFNMLAFQGATRARSGIKYAALWQKSDWLDTYSQQVFTTERMYRWSGIYPRLTQGTPDPQSWARALDAYVEQYDPATGATRLFHVGDDVPKVGRAYNPGLSPAGMTFSHPTVVGSAIDIGDLGPGESQAVWVRRTIDPGAAALTYDAGSIRLQGTTT